MFFWRDFQNMFALHRMTDLDPEIKLFAGALTSSQVGFIMGALFAPEAYQFFPYLPRRLPPRCYRQYESKRKQQKAGGPTPPPEKKRHHFLEVYADHRTAGTVSPVR